MAKTILIVDDSSSLRSVVGTALKGAGYDVIEAEDGRDALTKLNGQKIHLIISDVNMPNMNGIEFLQNVKQDPLLRRIPVIVLTTSEEQQDKMRSFDLGVAGYMTKPVDYRQFVEVVRSINLYWTISELP